MLWAWVSLLIRSGLIMGAAELLRRLSLKSGPAYRYRILASGFGLLLLWPAVSALLPEISLSVPQVHSGAIVTVTQTVLSLRPPKLPASGVKWPLIAWLLGVMLSLFPLLIGFIRIRRMAAPATPIEDPQWQSLLSEECDRLRLTRRPKLLRYQGAVVPLTCGLLRPRILLPFDCQDWEPSRRRMVLLHELMHIRRRDLLWQLFASVTTAFWWFQPLCWLNRRSLRQESERACDRWVIESGIRPSDYASELLEIAQGFSRARRPFPVAAAVAQPGDLEERLRAILNSNLTRFHPYPAVKILLLAGLTTAVSAVAIFPNQNNPQGDHPMKRTLISGLLVSAGLTAATISGSVYDSGGAAISNAEASLYNPDTGAKQEATTAPDGKFAFESLPAGSYILHVQKPGFASLYRVFNVKTDSDVLRGLVLDIAPPNSSADAAKQPPEPDTAKAIRDRAQSCCESTDPSRIPVPGEIAQSNLIQKVPPVYPAAAKSAGVQGTVKLATTISKEGIPEDIRVISSPSDDLTQSALEAVRQWHYRPTLLNGQPVAIVTEVIVNYTLTK